MPDSRLLDAAQRRSATAACFCVGLDVMRCSMLWCCASLRAQEECDQYAPFVCHNKLKATLSTTVELVRDGYALPRTPGSTRNVARKPDMQLSLSVSAREPSDLIHIRVPRTRPS